MKKEYLFLVILICWFIGFTNYEPGWAIFSLVASDFVIKNWGLVE